jgi:hypothetical protein
MNDLAHRIALVLLVAAGCATVVLQWPAPAASGGLAAMLLHRQFMLGLLGAALVLAAFWPMLRLPALAAAILSKAGFVALALLAADAPQYPVALLEGVLAALLAVSAGVFLHEARREARWNGAVAWRPEA